MQRDDLPPPVRTDTSNAFAHRSMGVRVPSIIDDTIVRNAYADSVADALKRLRDEVAGNAPLRLFEAPAPDYALWLPRYAQREGETWLGTEWLFAEMLVYRLMVEASGFLESGSDPFAPFKQEEMASEALWSTLEEVLAFEYPLPERLARTLKAMLWGNRIDLSIMTVAEQGVHATEEHLLTDRSEEIVAGLLERPPGAVHIVMDNAGTEEAMDLVWTDLLFSEGLATEIVLHVKMLPVLVSDVIPADFRDMLQAMTARGGAAARLSARLSGYMQEGRLRVEADYFWNTDGRYWKLPSRIEHALGGATLAISKGDANYRRATNDAIWPLETRMSEALGPFPAPLALLRTLKSDTLVEVPPDRAAELEVEHPQWRANGTYGVMQYAAGREHPVFNDAYA